MGEQTFREKMDAEVAAMATAAGIGREGGGAPPPGPVILSTRDFLDNFPPVPWERNPFHGIEVYQDQLPGVSLPAAGPAENCGAPWLCVKACGCGARVVRDHCDRLECAHPHCEEVNRKRRAKDIFDRIDQARAGREVIYTVLTVPPSRRAEAADLKTWKRWLRSLIAYLKKHHDLQYAVERSDPAGEDGETWHPHLNLLWIKKNGRGYLEAADLEAIKERWRRIVRMHPEDTPNVYTQFSAHDAKLRHWASYLARTWPRWAKGQKYLLRVKWFGRPPKVEDVAGPGLCRCCGEEVAVMRLGTFEAAEALAARGAAVVREEYQARIDELRKMSERRRPVAFRAAEIVIDCRR